MTGFNSGEPACDPGHQTLEDPLPAGRNYLGVRCRLPTGEPRHSKPTLRQFAPVSASRTSAAERIIDRLGPSSAFQQRKRFRKGAELIVDRISTDPWAVPFVRQLAGEYVLEILCVMCDGLGDLAIPGTPGLFTHGRFIADNPRLCSIAPIIGS